MMKKLQYLALTTCLIQLTTLQSIAQNFIEISQDNVDNFHEANVNWVDYDNDGDLDLFMCGTTNHLLNTRLYNNDLGILTLITDTNIPDLRRSSSDWADLNNDGLLDLVIIGIDGGDGKSDSFSLICYNNGDGTFEVNNLPDEDVYSSGIVKLGDLNNDGNTDIIISGYNDQRKDETAIYSNNRDHSFTKIQNTVFGNIRSAQLSLGDRDNDGDLDILMANDNPNDLDFVAVYDNQGDWSFEKSTVLIDDAYSITAIWNDMNNDGYLDVVVLGNFKSTSYNTILMLGSQDGFEVTDTPGLLPVANTSKVISFDYDSDGNLDLLIGGGFESGYDLKLFKNNGDLTFNEVLDDDFLSYYSISAFEAGDFDNDNDLDLLVVGYDLTFTSHVQFFQNQNTSNNSPIKPDNLNSTVDGRKIILDWDISSDSETPASTLTYNVKIGTESGGQQILSCGANNDGYNKLVKKGNTGYSNSLELHNLKNDTYYWSVQTVDNGLVASDFSVESTFIVDASLEAPIAPNELTLKYYNIDKIEITWNDLSFDETGFELERSIGVNTNYELLATIDPNKTKYIDANVENDQLYYYRIRSMRDAVKSGYSGENQIMSPKKGYFSKIDTTVLTTEDTYSIAGSLIDYNNDGLDDAIVLNYYENASIFKNLGGSNFELQEESGYTTLAGQLRNAVWADFNNDSFLDVFVQTSTINYLLRNNGDNTFSKIEEELLTSSEDSYSIAWGDINGDGNLDLFSSNYAGSNELFLNNGDESFTKEENSEISDTAGGIHAVFLDVNEDGFTDLFISIYFDENILYLNDGLGNLVKSDAYLGTGASVGSSWADYDNDGDFDVLITNNVNGSDYFYENDGHGNFSYQYNQIVASDIRGSSSAWIDFDNDGYEDVIMVTDSKKYLFKNDKNKDFELVDEYAINETNYANGVSIADINCDGFLDMYVINTNVKNELFINNSNSNNWVSVKLIGTINNKDAIGAKVKLWNGEFMQYKQAMSTSGSFSQSSNKLHFGLEAKELADLSILWPNNGVQIVKNVNINQTIEITEQQMPERPDNLIATPISSSEISLTWNDNSTIEDGYIIERSDSEAGTFTVIDSVGVNTTTYTDIELSYNTTYYYRLKSFIESGYSWDSNMEEATTFNIPPLAASNLTLEVTTPLQINLSWIDNSDNENNFEIYRSTTANDNYKVITTVDANVIGYDDQLVEDNVIYFYKIKAINQVGESEFSNETNATALDLPIAPDNLVAEINSVNQINLSWIDNSDNESEFVVYRSTSTNDNYEVITNADANSISYVDQSVEANTIYFYRIKAINQVGESKFSNEVSATALDLPIAPDNLVAEINAVDQINLSWTDNSDNESGFEIFKSISNNDDYKSIATVSENSQDYLDENVINQEVYYYKIKSINQVGESNFSKEATVSTITALDTESKSNEFIIYPNPTTESVTIAMKNDVVGDVLVSITDIYGIELVKYHFTKDSNFFEKKINVKNYSKGLFILRTTFSNEYFEKILVIE